MDVSRNSERIAHPKQWANIWSKLTFFYNLNIFWETYKSGTFKENQLYEVLDKCISQKSGDQLEKYLVEDTNKHDGISLVRVLWKCYGLKYLLLGIVQLLVRSAVIVTIPLTLSKVVLYFQPGQNELSKTTAIWFALLLISLNLISVTYIHNYLLFLSELGIKIRTALCSVIFRKCLKIPTIQLSSIGVGKIVTLITKDVGAIETLVFYFNDTWVGAAQALIVFCLIYRKMGLATCMGMGFFIAAIPVQLLIGRWASKLRLISCKRTDQRLQATKETLSNIAGLKMNTFEEVFEEKINKARKSEMLTILKIFLSKVSMLLIGSLTSRIAFYLLLISYVVLGNSISAELIYYVTTLFLRIRHALNTAIPVGVTVMADATASIKRIEELLAVEELTSKNKFKLEEKKAKVRLDEASVTIDDRVVLDRISLNVDTGLVVCSGPVASGKTTLLKTILGEYRLKTGTMFIDGTISYASQEPWIFPSTLKQNIIFDEPYDEQRYQTILEVCALNFDIQHLPMGDKVNTADKGTNISKGQKARINLARAVYKKADIYLIDDCLNSLDPHIRQHIIQKCLKEFLADKVCIIVTDIYNITGNKTIFINKGKVTVTQNNKHHYIDFNKFPEKDVQNFIDCYISDENVDSINENVGLIQGSDTIKLYEEDNNSGKVNLGIYRKYGNYGGGIIIIGVMTIFLIATHYSKLFTEKILSNWVNSIHDQDISGRINTNSWLQIYSIFIVSTTVLSIITSFLLFNFCRKASVNLHRDMTTSLLHTPMTFFDRHLLGNILNRFSKDLNVVDEQIPYAVYEFLEILFSTLGIIIIITTLHIIFILPIGIMFGLLYLLRQMYIPTGRSLQRLDMSTRSPVIGYLNSSLEGVITVRASQAEHILSAEFDRHQDLYTSANYTSICCQRAFGYYLDVCCTAFIAAIITIFIIFDKSMSVGDVGFAITQAFTLTGIVQYGIRQCADIENKMTSVERILEYIGLSKEVDEIVTLNKGFPKDNGIEYKDVSLTYGNNEGYSLKNVSLKVDRGGRIGIIGRTGSGKSSLLSLLFRLYPYSGTITIGGVNINSIPLNTLRSNISIISQDPILQTGSIRTNLDPKSQHSDHAIWKVIREVQLNHLIKSLDSEITESGSNLSAGQKQLICLARCLLSNNRVVIMDEATSDVDRKYEDVINDVMKRQLDGCTLIVVAHKLKTVLRICDRVVVMQEGTVVEDGDVKDLERNSGSILYSMLQKENVT